MILGEGGSNGEGVDVQSTRWGDPLKGRSGRQAVSHRTIKNNSKSGGGPSERSCVANGRCNARPAYRPITNKRFGGKDKWNVEGWQGLVKVAKKWPHTK